MRCQCYNDFASSYKHQTNNKSSPCLHLTPLLGVCSLCEATPLSFLFGSEAVLATLGGQFQVMLSKKKEQISHTTKGGCFAQKEMYFLLILLKKY